MKIIISPAKKMKIDTESLPWTSLPVFLEKTGEICSELKQLSYQQLKTLWKCNDAIAKLNAERLNTMDLEKRLTPAILAYEGIQYQYMAPGVFSDSAYLYIQNNLRIISGFYGILRPFDGVTPYRLEMQAKLQIGDKKDLYEYWDDYIAEDLFSETDCVINLASKEYSVCISKFLKPGIQFITCVFGEEKNGKIIEKGTLCKMARGEMVRYMAEHQIDHAEGIKKFDRLNYRFSEKYSSDSLFVFFRHEGDA